MFENAERQKEVKTMNLRKFIPGAAVVVGLLGFDQLPAQAQAQGILFKAQLGSTNACHLKFPAIREDTLGWNRPVLKSPHSGDIIDFYGPCDYDPTGKAAVRAQSTAYRLYRHRNQQ